MNWNEAQGFCKWLTNHIKGFRVRLPGEAEWEKAARGGLQIPHLQAGHIIDQIDNPNPQRIYPWGDEYPSSRKHCNFNQYAKDTTPIGYYSPQGDSPYGCADMAGDVWEWTISQFKNYPYQKDDGREMISDASELVQRGGSFTDVPKQVRCAYRSRDIPIFYYDNRGFRVVCSPI